MIRCVSLSGLLEYSNQIKTCHRSKSKVDGFITRIQTPVPVSETTPKANSTSNVEAQEATTATKIKVIQKQGLALDTDGRAGGGTRTNPEVHSTGQSSLTVHKWLESIDTFANELKTLMGNIWRVSHMGDEIRVALIDDGVDFLEKEFRDRIMHGKSFAAYHGDPNEREKQWYVSERGHGTVMAHMILRVCPMAKIYPIRLDTDRDPKTQSSRIKPESAIRVCGRLRNASSNSQC